MPSDRRTSEMHFLTPEQVNDLADRDRRPLPGRRLPRRVRRAARRRAMGADGCDRVNVLGRDRRGRGVDERGGRLARRADQDRKAPHDRRFRGSSRTMLGEHIDRYPSTGGYVFTAAEGGPVHHRNFRRRHCIPAVAGRRCRDEMSRHEAPVPRPAAHLRRAAHRERAAHRRGEGLPRPLVASGSRPTATGTCSRRRGPRMADALDETFPRRLPRISADFSRTSGGLARSRTRIGGP